MIRLRNVIGYYSWKRSKVIVKMSGGAADDMAEVVPRDPVGTVMLNFCFQRLCSDLSVITFEDSRKVLAANMIPLEHPYVSEYHHTSHLTPHTSHLTPHTSHLTPHTSHLTPHTSHLTPHTSHLTPHTSHLTPHLCYL